MNAFLQMLTEAGYVQIETDEPETLHANEYCIVNRGALTIVAFGPGKAGDDAHYCNFCFDTVTQRLVHHNVGSEE